jgi:predicted dehydrogenase
VTKILKVGVLGAGRWAQGAHIPGWQRDPRVQVVAVCDPQLQLAEEAGRTFKIPTVTSNHRELVERDDIDVIDVCTSSATHFQLTMETLQAGKHVLCEKPVGHDYKQTLQAQDLARNRGLKTKVGFTFRYSPAMMYMKQLIDNGYVGTPFIYNGYEQNSQWLDPQTPLRQEGELAFRDQSQIYVASLEGYGAPIIDLAHWFMNSDLEQVIGTMRNFIPERVVRETGKKMRVNLDDGDIFIGEFVSGALCSIQTSFVTVGNYPGLEARVYGSKGALICRLVEESGICESLKGAKSDAVEFKELPVPAKFYPPGGSSRESWRKLFYANLVSNFATEILTDSKSQGDFTDAAWVQETINAVELSFRKRAWINLPLSR